MEIPEALLNHISDHDQVYQSGENTLVSLHRAFETESSHIILNKHAISFGLHGYKVFHSPQSDIIVGKGEAIFLKKGLLISTEKVQEEGIYQAIVFFLEDQFLSNFYEKHQAYFKGRNEQAPAFFKIEADPVLDGYIQSLLPHFESKKEFPIPLFENKVNELLLNLAIKNQGGFQGFLESLNMEFSLGIKPFMEKNFKRAFRIEDFAHLMGMSLSGFKREFQRNFELSPARWIRERRLEEARTLLIKPNRNVSDVAYEVGFENASHFIQSFKAQYGITPKKFQEGSKLD